eukprot:1887122-Rhodomonas_salina.1
MEVITDAGTRAEYLQRANNDVREGSQPLSSFEDLLRGIRGNMWGNSDCLRHLARITNHGIVVFTQAANTVYYRWDGQGEVAGHVFLYNSRCPVTGKLNHFDPCKHSGFPSQASLDLISTLNALHRRAAQEVEITIDSSGPEEELGRVGSDLDASENEAVGIIPDLEPRATRTRIEHEQLTTFLHTRGLAGARVPADSPRVPADCFYSSISQIPAHALSGLSVSEIRARAVRTIRIRWEVASEQERIHMLHTMGRTIEQYVRGVAGTDWADELVMITVSRMIEGSISLWAPGPNHMILQVIRDESVSETILVNIQHVNVNRDGMLNHFEPLIETRDQQAKKPKKQMQKRKRKPADKEVEKKGNRTEGASFPSRFELRRAVHRTGEEKTSSSGATPQREVLKGARIPFFDKKAQLPRTMPRAHWGFILLSL